jgi:hypothetical protein
MTTITEARFAIETRLVQLAAENGGEIPSLHDMRFFLYPDPSRRWVLACAELEDGRDLQELFELEVPVVGDHLDENAVRERFFDVPSGARH